MRTFARGLRLGALVLSGTMGLLAGRAGAQELVFSFKDPAFGGNPFNGTYLLDVAGYSRPAQPTTATSQEDLLVAQLKSQLTSSVSTSILTTIQSAKAGDTGKFVEGNETISYSRTATATTVTFTNATTGQTSQLVIPVAQSSAASPFASATTVSPASAGATAERSLLAASSSAVPLSTVSGAAGLEISLAPAPL